MYNKEHYPDPTAYQAVANIEKERLSKMIREIQIIMDRYGFELIERVQVRGKDTGKIYK